MNEVTRHTGSTSLAVHLGPRTLGYSFAYAAAMRVDLDKLVATDRGGTFFWWFAKRNDALTDEDVSP